MRRRFPKWQKRCEVALLEPDPQKLFLRVLVAETAIFHRLHDPTSVPGAIELEAMDHMLKSLQRLLVNVFIAPPAGECGEEFASTAENNTGSGDRVCSATQPSA